MATVSINLDVEFNKLIHRPMYKGVVCYTHPEGYNGGSAGDGVINGLTVKNKNLNSMGFTVLDGDGQVDAAEVVKATRSYMNSPGNIRRLYFTYRGVVVLYYTSFIEKGQRSTRGHWVARSFPSGLDLKEVFFKMLSYQSDYNRYRMEKQVNKNAKEPTRYTIGGKLLHRAMNPWMLSNIEEIYFDWVGLLSAEQEVIRPDKGFPNKYNVLYSILNGEVKPQIVSTFDFVQTLSTWGVDIVRGDNKLDRRDRFPRLRTITFVSNLGDLLFDPSIPIDKVDSEFTDVSKAGVMWYRSPQNVEIFKRTGSVVWYYDITKDLKVRNTNFSKKPGIYLFDEKYLTPVFDSYVQKINDYNNKLKYGDKVEESTEEDKVESSEATSSRLDELVDRVVKARGPQAASYILRVAATGYSSKEIHGIIKSASESNQPAIKRYMGVN